MDLPALAAGLAGAAARAPDGVDLSDCGLQRQDTAELAALLSALQPARWDLAGNVVDLDLLAQMAQSTAWSVEHISFARCAIFGAGPANQSALPTLVKRLRVQSLDLGGARDCSWSATTRDPASADAVPLHAALWWVQTLETQVPGGGGGGTESEGVWGWKMWKIGGKA